MKVTFLVAMVAFAAATPSIKEQWMSFKKEYDKSYRSVEEEFYRMEIFMETLVIIEEQNSKYEAGISTYHLEMNQFGDMHPEELIELGLSTRQDKKPGPGFPYLPPANVEIPVSIDWRVLGAVTPVKNQGKCGSCWAISSTGAIEGQLFKKTGQLFSLSIQQLLDCTIVFYNYGCVGGLMDIAFSYLTVVEGLESEDAYPYEGKTRSCRYNKDKVVAGTKVKAYTDIKPSDDDALKAAVATVGPISTAISAGNKHFLHYKGGIFDGDTCNTINLDHGILLVGYGSENGLDYWLLKNSWGPRWGEKGYLKLTRSKRNACGISTMASFPIL